MEPQNPLRVQPRVNWYEGQTLLPEHMRAQEESILSESRALTGLWGLPDYGVARLALRDERLITRLGVSELSVVFENGQLCTKGGNAILEDLDLEDIPGTECMVYVHLLEKRSVLESAGEMKRDRFHLELSTESSGGSSASVMPLLRLEKNDVGEWHLSPGFSPPLLVLNESPFLRPELHRLESLLVEFEDELKHHSSGELMRESNRFSARRTRVEGWRLIALLANARGHVRVHPCQLVEALRSFYLEACASENIHPGSYGTTPYRHNDIAALVGGYIDALHPRLAALRQLTTYNHFKEWQGMFLNEPLPPDLAKAKEVYLLIQRPDLHTQVSIDEVKLSHREQLPEVHRRSLSGITFTPVDRTAFQHPFEPEVDFYRIEQDEDWKMALRANSVALYITPALLSSQPSLYWRGE